MPIDTERARRLAERQETVNELASLDLGAQTLLTELRNVTDPLLADRFTEIDVPRASGLMAQLTVKWDRATALERKIERLNAALGE